MNDGNIGGDSVNERSLCVAEQGDCVTCGCASISTEALPSSLDGWVWDKSGDDEDDVIDVGDSSMVGGTDQSDSDEGGSIDELAWFEMV